MHPHDPYGPMLAELRRLNDTDTEELFQDSLHQAQPYVTNLRLAYKKSPSNVDFSCQHTRAAYLLAYYPNYIEPLYEILCSLPPDIIQSAFDCEKLRGLFLGAGPAPEVLGWISFLNEHFPQTRTATAYLLDKYIDGWRTGQDITRYHLAPDYWPQGQLTIRPLEFDFLDPMTLTDPFVQRSTQISNLVVMQNCLNDQLNNRQAVLAMLQNVFRLSRPGTVFVISDLQFPAVRNFMCEMIDFVIKSRLGQILLPIQDQPIRSCVHVEVPQIILDHLLIGDAARNLIARKYACYYATAFQRIE
jgi:hypothetical protein